MKDKIYKMIRDFIESTGLKTEDIIFISGCIIVLIILSMLIINIKLIILNKKYKQFMQGSDGRSLEEEIRSRLEDMDSLSGRIVAIEEKNEKITTRLNNSFQKIGIVKYDAFKEMGGKLSFALALLSDKSDGFVINVMHSREGCYSYIKEIIDGKCDITLSDDEKEALDNAIVCQKDS